jgi:pseudouridine-5'-phosphate glycosidase
MRRMPVWQLRSQIGFGFPQRAGGHLQGDTDRIIVNPPPAENALPRAEVESLISGAVAAAEAAGIRGKAVTPFLLEQLARNSGGKTLQTNIALLVANARLAAGIAVAYSARKAGC